MDQPQNGSLMSTLQPVDILQSFCRRLVIQRMPWPGVWASGISPSSRGRGLWNSTRRGWRDAIPGRSTAGMRRRRCARERGDGLNRQDAKNAKRETVEPQRRGERREGRARERGAEGEAGGRGASDEDGAGTGALPLQGEGRRACEEGRYRGHCPDRGGASRRWHARGTGGEDGAGTGGRGEPGAGNVRCYTGSE